MAMLYAKRNRLIPQEELIRLEELNRAANSAKHEGLGVDEPSEGTAAREEAMQEAGNCVGELEAVYGKLVGLAQRKPRYRYRPRPGNMGDFVSVVHLDAFDPPMEFCGDGFKTKQPLGFSCKVYNSYIT